MCFKHWTHLGSQWTMKPTYFDMQDKPECVVALTVPVVGDTSCQVCICTFVQMISYSVFVSLAECMLVMQCHISSIINQLHSHAFTTWFHMIYSSGFSCMGDRVIVETCPSSSPLHKPPLVRGHTEHVHLCGGSKGPSFIAEMPRRS